VEKKLEKLLAWERKTSAKLRTFIENISRFNKIKSEEENLAIDAKKNQSSSLLLYRTFFFLLSKSFTSVSLRQPTPLINVILFELLKSWKSNK
jgi:hypothetical protein